ncbi:MAG TPA: hypothetical protein VFO91_00885 [Anaerolineales bacterium]|nr:hypothetical protein [Anaerolineales bacterium]
MTTGDNAVDDPLKKRRRAEKFYPLEKHLRELAETQEEATLTFDQIEEILKEELPPEAYKEREWWSNQVRGLQVQTIPWMDAGWLVESVDLHEKWVRFVRQ